MLVFLIAGRVGYSQFLLLFSFIFPTQDGKLYFSTKTETLSRLFAHNPTTEYNPLENEHCFSPQNYPPLSAGCFFFFLNT
jgi:hypothetical protein